MSVKSVSNTNPITQKVPTLPIEQKSIIDTIAKYLPKEDVGSCTVLAKDVRGALVTNCFREKQARLDRAWDVFKEIVDDEKPDEIKGLESSLKNLKKIEAFLKARDALVVWDAIAEQSGAFEDRPDFSKLTTFDAYRKKAEEFDKWLDSHVDEIELEDLIVQRKNLSAIPAPIGKLTGLQKLDFSGNKIQKIENIESLSGLKQLILRENQIKKIEGLTGLRELQRLDLFHNQIVKMEGLEDLVALRGLGLAANQIEKIEGLETLTALENLGLRGNQIKKIEGLQNLGALGSLILNKNKIEKIEGLDSLQALTTLQLAENRISKIEGLEHLQALNWVGLKGNQIKRIEGLEAQIHLDTLNLKNNQIENTEGIEALPQGSVVELKGNPCTA